VANWVLNTPLPESPLFGPLASHGARFWGFLAAGRTPAARDILELVPVQRPEDEQAAP
jgi:hypothetical protein